MPRRTGLIATVLVGVLALEVGSSLAVVLARSVDTGARRLRGRPLAAAVDTPTPAPPKPAEPVQPPARAPQRAKGRKGAAAAKIVDTLRVQGGRAPTASVRRLGRSIGATKSTTFNALAMLVASGVIERVGADLVLRG